MRVKQQKRRKISPLNKKKENKLRREKERGQIKNGSSTHRNVKWWNLKRNLHQKMIHIDVIKKNNALIKSTIICIIYEFKMKKLPKKLSSRSCWIIAAINRTFDLVCSLPLAFSRPIADKSIKSFLTRSQKSVRLCSACVVFCWHLTWFMWNYLFDWNHQTNTPLMKRIIALKSARFQTMIFSFFQVIILGKSYRVTSNQICSAYIWKVQVNYLNILSLWNCRPSLLSPKPMIQHPGKKVMCLHANLKRFWRTTNVHTRWRI